MRQAYEDQEKDIEIALRDIDDSMTAQDEVGV